MESHITSEFRRRFAELPEDVKRAAKSSYRLWSRDAFRASLQFKAVREGIWSVRIGLHWRALARKTENDVTWFWIGSHGDYDKLI